MRYYTKWMGNLVKFCTWVLDKLGVKEISFTLGLLLKSFTCSHSFLRSSSSNHSWGTSKKGNVSHGDY